MSIFTTSRLDGSLSGWRTKPMPRRTAHLSELADVPFNLSSLSSSTTISIDTSATIAPRQPTSTATARSNRGSLVFASLRSTASHALRTGASVRFPDLLKRKAKIAPPLTSLAASGLFFADINVTAPLLMLADMSTVTTDDSHPVDV
ncbi:uncharacterized protein STEHIDRAFT_162830 [Stereum hirsutum FP-91666 SS1]|uniref:Uncharacterized protein n=1 Tax=Stereum hirsutum (strain FP-91666) TaxID=721885 RepID=R7RYL2_STEHR|nr:uncharacterized protein STEHIDRAFT_162830 [Stereum hirsutum FP-91666 SS1]EIM80414.1 hypothetical protein STEHIDRAFT_162830 [Stereum hirsutum FP-91666 SS1]